MTDESEDEDEVVKKKKVSKATKKKAPKKTQKETKKKVSKKIVKKKAPPQKKKSLTVKGNIKTAKETSKNVQVGSFLKTPVNIPPSCFSRYPKVALTRIPCQTREDQLTCLDPVQQKFPDPVPQTTANPPQIENLSTSPKTISKAAFKELCKNKGCKTAVKTYPSFIKNFHGSIHINCKYTKFFSNQS